MKSEFCWNLSFLDKELEKEYRESKFSFLQPFYRVFAFSASIILLVGHFTDPFNEGILDPIRFIATLGNMTFIHFPILIFRKFPKRIELFVILSLQLITIATIEAAVAKKSKRNSIFYFINGNMIMSMFLCPLIFKIDWKYTFGYCILTSVHTQTRCINKAENLDLNYYPLLNGLFYAFLLVTLSYMMEKNDRRTFSMKRNYESSLKCFKNLIKEVLPTSILICKEMKVFYSNSHANQLFNTSNQEELFELCKNVKIQWKLKSNLNSVQIPENKSDELIPALSKNSSIHEKEVNSGLIPKNKENNQNPVCNLHELIGNVNSENELEVSFQVYSGVFEGSMDNLNTQPAMQRQHLEIKISSIFWEGKRAIIVLISEDTYINKVMMLKEKNLYKDQLLATVSHDLRTPLNGIIGMINHVLEEILAPEIVKSLNLVLRSAQHLLFMINDILDYSQINNGKLRINLEEVKIVELIKEISKLIKFQAKRKGLNFFIENNLPSNESNNYSVKSDIGRLKQIVLNLLGNALKFTQEGQIKVVLSKKTNSSNIPFVEIRVEDTGCGISKEDIPKLFQYFGKLRTKESKEINKSGIGLGLAISQSLLVIINKNQPEGIIRVESEVGKGSCFYFGIFSNEDLDSDNEFNERMRVGLIPKPNFINSEQIFNTKKVSNIKILVVDDDQVNLIVASKYLQNIGAVDFSLASNGKEAIRLIESYKDMNLFFDIVLMDCNMPFMDGFEATRIILQKVRDGDIPAVSIIACTANASEEDYSKCFRAGMVDYLSKPFMKKDLKEKIDGVLLKRRDVLV